MPAEEIGDGYSVVGGRMADREMVLRFLAFRMTSPHAYKPGDFSARHSVGSERASPSSSAKLSAGPTSGGRTRRWYPAAPARPRPGTMKAQR
ncbi:hypothetical protein GCM10010297_41600 [Streptomyces malachitofuscus]|nr:hypothetical protein GCM10010297_41600 [Streptomyces malachitofuscus]